MDLYSNDTLVNVVKKIKALGYFNETKEDPRVVADSIGYEIRRMGVTEGRIELYFKSVSGEPYIEAYLIKKRILIIMPKTWRFFEDIEPIEPSEGTFKNIEIYPGMYLCSVDLSKKTQHEVDMEVLLSEVMGGAYIGKMGFGDFNRHTATQLTDEMEWPSAKVDW